PHRPVAPGGHAVIRGRGGHGRGAGLRPRWSRPLVPRGRRPGTVGLVGQHAQSGAQHPGAYLVPVAVVRAGTRHLPHRDGLQLPRRRIARRPRPTPRHGGQVVSDPLLRLEDLRTWFHTDDAVVRAVDGVSFEVNAGETLAVVGESGSGKSVTALSILRLIAQPPGRIEGGRILFRGRDLVTASDAEMRRIRGRDISMIFQEPMTSLNPVFTCGEQIIEAVVLHDKVDRKAARIRAIEMLELVGIPSPAQRVDEYPHQLSGGMRQRIMIAMALACRPSVLIADEPTTALDVTIQAQILHLIRVLQKEMAMEEMFITHDMCVVTDMAYREPEKEPGEGVE